MNKTIVPMDIKIVQMNIKIVQMGKKIQFKWTKNNSNEQNKKNQLK